MSQPSISEHSTRPLPTELYDLDGNAIIATRIDKPSDTRGKAAAFFTSEWGLDFTAVKVRKRWFDHDLAYAAEMAADGIAEPYDGWPLRECEPGAGAAYWTLDEECYL